MTNIAVLGCAISNRSNFVVVIIDEDDVMIIYWSGFCLVIIFCSVAIGFEMGKIVNTFIGVVI